MKVSKENDQTDWAVKWLDKVADGSGTMSQRKLSVIEKRCGMESLKKLAQERSIHLLQIRDDKGNELIAASVNPSVIIC